MTARRGRLDRPARGGEIILGRNAVLEVLRAGRRQVRLVHFDAGVQPGPVLQEIQKLASSRQVPVKVTPGEVWEERGEKAHGVAAEVSPYPYVAVEDILLAAEERQEPLLALLLDELQDPQNLGTLLRTAEACGVHGVVIPYRRAAGITPAVVRASAGACEHMLIAAENLAQAIDRLHREGARIVGLEADPGVGPWEAVDLAGPLGLVVGSEGQGMRHLVRQRCDVLARLAVAGQIGSLNVAVAGSIALYLVWSTRRQAGAGAAARVGSIDAPRES
ncbi:MAG TPA: RNA methyltransferase [Anaerolineales bacterium]|nr:RNA methyltransferase [Anaerolineales bacterium]